MLNILAAHTGWEEDDCCDKEEDCGERGVGEGGEEGREGGREEKREGGRGLEIWDRKHTNLFNVCYRVHTTAFQHNYII